MVKNHQDDGHSSKQVHLPEPGCRALDHELDFSRAELKRCSFGPSLSLRFSEPCLPRTDSNDLKTKQQKVPLLQVKIPENRL
jgi:hypothetical protein